ncbi:MAG: aspartate kinase, partial [Candidatus Moranbacteria bacterium]|nr:aspartate kinase [Candidatus Moranbacteria bacterium]
MSAPGKRTGRDDEKITDLLIACHDLNEGGKPFTAEFDRITGRFKEIVSGLELTLDIDGLLGEIRQAIQQGATLDYVRSRG